MKKGSIFLIIIFVFISVFKNPLIMATSGITQTSEIPANIFDGIYYIDGHATYVWVVREEIPEDAAFYVTYLDQDGVFHETELFYFGDMVYSTADIKQLNPESSYFSLLWFNVLHINRLVEAGYLFYEITFGVSKPFIDFLYRIEPRYADKIIPMYTKQKIDDIFNYMDYLSEISEEDLLREYNRGYDAGYTDGYTDGYDVGGAVGFEDGYFYGHDIGYNKGYNDGINEQLADKDFTHMLKSVFVGVGSFLGINLLPGITIGAIIAVPIVFGIIAFILGKRKD